MPAPDSNTKPKKRTISYILSHNPGTHDGFHSLGVNSLQYNKLTNSLISGGRDGLISIWSPQKSINSTSSSYDDYDSDYNSRSAIKKYISNNLENESEIVKLENSIRQGLSAKPINNSNYIHKTSYHLHLDWINDLKLVDPESNTIASCSNDLSVKLWNVRSNTDATLGFHSDYVKCLAYSPTLKNQVISGGLDKSINIWDTIKQTKLSSYTFKQDRGSIYSLSAYANLIISGGPTNIVTLFDRRAMNKPIKSFVGHTDNVRCLKLNEDYILSGSSDSTIKLWDLKTNRILRNFDMHDSPVWSLYVPDENYDNFDVFYSGDRNGLLLKTDLRASDLASDSSTEHNYLNDKVNKSLGISTIVADLNINCRTDAGNSNDGSEFSSAPVKGVLSIVGGSNTIWTSNVVGPNDYVSSWAVPNTNKLVMYQGIKLNRNLSMLNKSNRTSIDMQRGDTNNFDLVSQLSNDDLNHIDEALTSQLTLNNPAFELGYTSLGNSNSQVELHTPTSEEKIETFFVCLTGGPNGEFIFADQDDESSDEAFENSDRQGLEITYTKVPENVLTFTPFNIQATENFKGSNGLIKARLLNNRRHVAVLDQTGSIYVIDIVNCKIIRKLDTQLQNPHSTHVGDDFEEATNSLQTEETLPQWCNVQTKAGRLFVTLQESNFTACAIFGDDLAEFYPEITTELDETKRYYLGKIVLQSLFEPLVKIEQSPERIKHHKMEQLQIKRTTTQSSQPSSSKFSRERLASLASINDSLGERKDGDKPEKENKPKRKLFGRSKTNTSVKETATIHEVKPPTDEEIIAGFNNSSDFLYWLGQDESRFEVCDDTPTLKLDPHIQITLNENMHTYGSVTKTLQLARIGTISSTIDGFEKYSPLWAMKALLLDKYPLKDPNKIGFSLNPDTSTYKDLSTIQSNKLNGFEFLRVSKLIEHAKSRLPENQKHFEFELICKDQVLPERMTLITIKTRIWKSSSDIEFFYRVKELAS